VRVRAGVLALVLLAAVGCQGEAKKPGALIVVSAPLATQPWIGQFLDRGAQLAATQLHGAVRIQVRDNGSSAQTAVAIARDAVRDGAVALVMDGVGARAVAAVTDPAKLAVFIAFEGGASLIDPKAAPTLFRMAPANRYLCRRLADYLADTRPGVRVGVLSDDSAYGREGAANVTADLRHDDVPVVSDQAVPEHARDVSAQVLAARRAGATLLVAWARAPAFAAVVRAARSNGWDVPIYGGPSSEDPLVRQQLADHPEWVDDLAFVSYRITSETGPAPFAAYRADYEKEYGADKVGVKVAGKDVVMPPDWSTYPYDAVKLVAAAIEHAGEASAAKVYEALQTVSITGANGDERGFGPDDREGVSPDDMYLAHFENMRFVPNKDDKLSTSLPTVPQ
jgi:ABC-type branched-subunit amino acid transport system substrate-binding protein